MVRMTVDSSALEKLYAEKLAVMPVEARKAFDRMIRDTERHAQMVIAKQVPTEYAIKSADVRNPANGGISVRRSAGAVTLVYRGRTLTLHHFKYTPKKTTHKSRRMRAEVKRTGYKSLGSHAFVGGTGAKSAGKVASIPFMREGKKAKPIKAIRSVSVPQMVGNEDAVVPAVLDDLGAYMFKRFEHHFGWYSEGSKK